MKLRFARIPVHEPDAASEDLNRFLVGHRILAIDRKFIDNGDNSDWAICMT